MSERERVKAGPWAFCLIGVLGGSALLPTDERRDDLPERAIVVDSFHPPPFAGSNLVMRFPRGDGW